jgi:hypothetical protein
MTSQHILCAAQPCPTAIFSGALRFTQFTVSQHAIVSRWHAANIVGGGRFAHASNVIVGYYFPARFHPANDRIGRVVHVVPEVEITLACAVRTSLHIW